MMYIIYTMIRTQVLLTPDQHAFLQDYAGQRGESVSAIVREAVDRLQASLASHRRRAVALLGAFEADVPDVSVQRYSR